MCATETLDVSVNAHLERRPMRKCIKYDNLYNMNITLAIHLSRGFWYSPFPALAVFIILSTFAPEPMRAQRDEIAYAPRMASASPTPLIINQHGVSYGTLLLRKYKAERRRHRHDLGIDTESSPLPVLYRAIITSELSDTCVSRAIPHLKQAAIADGVIRPYPPKVTQ